MKSKRKYPFNGPSLFTQRALIEGRLAPSAYCQQVNKSADRDISFPDTPGKNYPVGGKVR
jgi:hypothetical protein